MPEKFKFTKKVLQELTPQEKRKRYYDLDVAGLVCDVTPAGKKVFRVYKRLKHQSSPLSVTLGSFPELTIEQARQSARDTLNKIVNKQNPNIETRKQQEKLVTMKEVFLHYKVNKSLSVNTLRGYNQVMDCYLEDYREEPLIYFDENTVKKVHANITKRSKAQADLTMRFIRALFNFAKFEYRDENGVSHFEENPVHILSHLRAWHHVGRKQTYLNGQQIGAFLDAVDDVRNEGIATSMLFPISVCDYIETALFTGLRKTELVQLKWEQVNLDERSFWVEKTKNGDPLKLPISPHLQSIFERRKEYQTESPYVFNAVNNVGRIVEPKKVLHKVSERGEVVFSMHDLRRTFTTVAERIQTGTYTLKRLLNHKTGRNDVTAGYTVLTPEELREPAKRIENKILELAGRRQKADEVKSGLVDIASLSKEEKLALAQLLLSQVH